jgi:transcription antitermination factor NusG
MNLLKELEIDNKETKIDLSALSLEELNKVIFDANRLIRKKQFEAREQRKDLAKTALKVGDIVKVVSERFDGEIWEVLKLNPKKVKCKRENGETWNIHYANIETI